MSETSSCSDDSSDFDSSVVSGIDEEEWAEWDLKVAAKGSAKKKRGAKGSAKESSKDSSKDSKEMIAKGSAKENSKGAANEKKKKDAKVSFKEEVKAARRLQEEFRKDVRIIAEEFAMDKAARQRLRRQ